MSRQSGKHCTKTWRRQGSVRRQGLRCAFWLPAAAAGWRADAAVKAGRAGLQIMSGPQVMLLHDDWHDGVGLRLQENIAGGLFACKFHSSCFAGELGNL